MIQASERGDYRSDARRPTSHADAEKALADAPYLAYCLCQAAKLFLSLTARRWPELR